MIWSATLAANRLCTACLVTPSAALISDQDRPSRRQRSTKWPSRASLVSSICATVVAAVDELVEGVRAVGVLADGIDEVLKAWRWRHESTIG